MKAYTIIEVLVVLAVIAIFGTIIVAGCNVYLDSQITDCKIDFRLNGNSTTNYKISIYSNNAYRLIQEFKLLPINWRLNRKWGLID